ncbi:MAG: glycoside hydrolase family 2 [Clostridia bacterium]|nr:glycoside hydrolase family 2 [Clostridia bacterium]
MKKTVENHLYTTDGESLCSMPWNVYPRPRLVRDSFFCLNGDWALTATDGEEYTVRVPFPPESLLSGVCKRMGEKPHIVYKKSFSLPEGFVKKRVILHFGAVDQIAEVELNGKYLGKHIGGYEHFSFDITDALKSENELVVTVTNADDPLSLPYGKQCEKRGGMWYTPVTGIWQTVWVESVPENYVTELSVRADGNEVEISALGVKNGEIIIDADGTEVKATLVDGRAKVTLDSVRAWSPEDPYLYRYTLNAEGDLVSSYFAIRKVSIEKINGRELICLNSKPIFLHGLLDQGYFSDGIFTPATPEEYKRDILSMKELGFNMLRKHIKIEPDIFYYYCDLYGMTVMQDMINNGDYSFIRDTALPTVGFKKRNDKRLHRDEATRKAYEEGMESTVKALGEYPSIVGWTVFNEGWGQFCSQEMYEKMKSLDSSRFADTASGWFSGAESDVESQHIYFKPIKIKKTYDKPLIISEFGGYACRVDGHIFNTENEYGYKSFKTVEELEDAFVALYENEIIPAIEKGLCCTVYTQVSDVEDETNGLLTYDRKVCKVGKERIKALSDKLYSAFEKENG